MELFGCDLWEEQRFEIFIPLGPMLTKNEKYSLKFKFVSFVRSIEKKFQENFEIVWLQFVGGLAFLIFFAQKVRAYVSGKLTSKF